MWQAEHVASIIRTVGVGTEIVSISTLGDTELEKPLYEIGEVGVFTKQLDDAVLSGAVDVAVHSLKDVPTIPVEGLSVMAVIKRGTAYDVLIASSQHVMEGLDTTNATVATSSRRRMAQWLSRHPGHRVVSLRGNVHTRLAVLERGDIDAIILAEAGLERLGIKPSATRTLGWMVPAPAQGAIGIVAKVDDDRWSDVWLQLTHEDTYRAVNLERELLRRLSAGCSSPVGIYVTLEDASMHVRATVLSVDGARRADAEVSVPRSTSDLVVAQQVMEILTMRGAQKLLDEARHA